MQAGKTGGGTIADGIAVKHPGELTMSILDDLLDDIVHVEDDAIARGDHAPARALEARRRRRRRRVGRGAARTARRAATDVCALLSGGNIDATLLVSVVRHGLTRAGRSSCSARACPTGPASS